MASSLLAFLYPHIRGSQEDIATYSLQYILSESRSMNRSFRRILMNLLDTDLPEDLHYLSQPAGKNRERPDMAVLDKNGKEYVLCEAKFYAGLTKNQPLTYLNRLKENGGVGLVFICPEKRLTALWEQLRKCCSDGHKSDFSGSIAIVDGIRIGIISWSNLLLSLTEEAANHAPEMMSDIRQLDGYCREMDEEAFIPFTADDFSPVTARKAEQYYLVIDELYERIKADPFFRASGEGLQRAPSRQGYMRYLRIGHYTLGLAYDRSLWKKTSAIETPFWYYICNREWKQDDGMMNAFAAFEERRKGILNNHTAFALEPMTDCALDELTDSLLGQIKRDLSDLLFSITE